MRIAVDAREMETEATGVGRYLAEILKHWDPAVFRRHQIYLYFKTRVPDLSFLAGAPAQAAVIGPGRPVSDLWWEQAVLPRRLRRDRIDVFWGAGGSCSWLRFGWRSVVNVYDLTFFADPSWFSRREAFVRRWKTAVAVRRAACLIVLSDATKEDLARRFGALSNKAVRIYAGADHREERTGGSEGARKEFGAKLLYVGSVLNRRPVDQLIRAAGMLRQRFPALTLTVIGDNRTCPRQDLEAIARAEGVPDRVRLLGYVSEAVLEQAYDEADLFCYPSLCEGFGIPVVEAQRRGLPVLTLRNSSLAEIAGDSAHYAAGPRAEDLAAALEVLLSDPDRRADLARRGLRNARTFLWAESARAVWDVLSGGEACAPSS